MDGDPKYYWPYYASDSDEESDLSSDELSDDYITPPLPRPENAEEDISIPDYSDFARHLREPVMLASGPSFLTDEVDLQFGINQLKKDIIFGPVLQDGSGNPLSVVTRSIDNVIILESINRDFNIYPQPTVCTLRLPREYKSVSSFVIVEIGFNSTLFYFNSNKFNLQVQLIEQGRLEYEYTLIPSRYIPLVLKATIREGSYTIDSLLTELQIQLNTPPLFFDFINGYTDFADQFQSTGDYSLNFNYPGDYYYDSLHRIYIPNPTRDIISSYYFQSRFATTGTLGSYTTDQIHVAYYYPILKEYLLDPTTSPSEYADYITEEDIRYILYNFQGLLDEKVINLTTNTSPFKIVLDTYRIRHTFRYRPINQYSCTYNQTNNIVCIQTNGLNTSLVSLLNSQYNTILRTVTAKYPSYNYQNIIGIINTLHAILNGMYQLIQTTLVLIYGASYGQYAMLYFTDFDNQLIVRNTTNILNPVLNNNFSDPLNISTDILTNFQIPSIWYWQNMMNLSYSLNLNGGSANHPFDLLTLKYVLDKPFIDETGFIYTNYAEQSGDILVHIPAGQYAIFQFTSKFVQTMQIEILPKPSSLRYTEWNIANLSTPNNTLFSIPYSTIVPLDVSYIQNASNPIPTRISLTNLFTMDAITTYINGSDITLLTTMRNGLTFTYTAPRPPSVTSVNVKAKYTLYISVLPGLPQSVSLTINSSNGISYTNQGTSTGFTDTCILFVYHSQAGFYADTGPNGLLKENPLFYKYSYRIPAGSPILNFSYNVYEGETYYILIRPLNDVFTSIPFRILPYVTSTPIYELSTRLASSQTDPTYFDPTSPSFDYTRYLSTSFIIARVHDPDWLELPILPTTMTPDTAPINVSVSTILPVMGYDINNVSNDATDYIPIVAGISTALLDPINGYVFNKTSQYDILSLSYQLGNSTNYITNPVNVRYQGNFKNVSQSFKICNYNATTYISTTGELVANINSYTSSITSGPLNGYSYDANGNLILGAGACGFSFLPTDGTWTVDTITFKGQSSRTAVQLLAIFPTYQIYNKSVSTILSLLPKAASIAILQSSNIYPRTSLNGSYYTYSTIHTNGALRGSIQVPSVSIPDVNSYYSILSFGGSTSQLNTLTDVINAIPILQVVPIENLAGSPIPYPYAYTSVRSGVFYDGVSSINQRDMVLAGGQTNGSLEFLPNTSLFHDKSVSAYEQSMPIVNSHVHFVQGDNFLASPTGVIPWANIPIQPSNIIATVPGFLLLQGNMYVIVSYTRASTNFTQVTTLSDDFIFPPSENTFLLSVTGNTSGYVFLGYSYSINKFRIKIYNPVTNILTSIPYTLTTPYSVNQNIIGNFVFSNTRSWWITYTIVSLSQSWIYGVTDSGIEVSLQLSGTQGYVTMDPSVPIVYYASGSHRFSTVRQFASSVGPSLSDTSTTLIGYNITSFTQMTAYGRILYLLDGISPTYFSWNTSTPNVYTSSQIFTNIPTGISIGPVNSFWVLFNTSPYIMAHAFEILSIDIAWQIFFPAMKIKLKIVTPMYTSITNRSGLSSEWQHSAAFVYSTFNSFSNDILANRGQWGMESNYMVSDTSFSGYDYNAYIQNIPVRSNWSPTPLASNAPNAYYLAVRGFSPTEDFNAILRWKVPNRTDYGYKSISTLMNECDSFPYISTNYSLPYITSISTLNPIFNGINTYGLSIASGLSGSTIQTFGLSDFLQKYSTIHTLYSVYQQYLSNVNTNVTGQMSTYLASNLQYIIPSTFLTRMVYTDAIPFSLQWSTLTAKSPIPISQSVSEWGIGWNLGYVKQDTSFAIIHYADSLFKIQDEYIYLKLNREFNINRLDTGSKENYADSREPTGVRDQYYCKLLLNGFGNKATTFTHNPVTFNPPLSRLSKMTFEWVDARGNSLSTSSSTNSEWNMTIHIQEQIKSFDFTTLSIQTSMSTLMPKEGRTGSLSEQELAFSTITAARR
jgi:hypothetical protein